MEPVLWLVSLLHSIRQRRWTKNFTFRSHPWRNGIQKRKLVPKFKKRYNPCQLWSPGLNVELFLTDIYSFITFFTLSFFLCAGQQLVTVKHNRKGHRPEHRHKSTQFPHYLLLIGPVFGWCRSGWINDYCNQWNNGFHCQKGRIWLV